MPSSLRKSKVIYGCCTRLAGGELFVPLLPQLDQPDRREVIKTINTRGYKCRVDVRKPFIQEPSDSRPSNDESQVRQNVCLGGEVTWACEL